MPNVSVFHVETAVVLYHSTNVFDTFDPTPGELVTVHCGRCWWRTSPKEPSGSRCPVRIPHVYGCHEDPQLQERFRDTERG